MLEIPILKASSKPWFSAGLHNSCCKKNTLYKTNLKNSTPTNKLVYTKYRNKYNYTVKLARKKYYHDKLDMQQSNLKATWSTIKTVIGSKSLIHFALQINLMIILLILVIPYLKVFPVPIINTVII